MLNKKQLLFLIFLNATLVYPISLKKSKLYEECIFSENYESLTINKTEHVEGLVETKLFGLPSYNRIITISQINGGIFFDYHFYKIENDNICLSLKTYNSLQDDAIIFINTQKECGSKCKVYLSEPEDKQIFYLWEPSNKIIIDKTKEKIIIKTDIKTYTIIVKKGITELELIATGAPKIKTIKGIDKFPNLEQLSLIGFDY